MSSAHLLAAETEHYKRFRDQLLEHHPDLDDETLLDTLEGATNLHEAVAAVLRSALEDEALISGLKDYLAALRERMGRLTKRVETKRELARSAMTEAPLRKLVEPDFTASLRESPPSIDIVDESAIPEWFWIPQPAKLDRKRLLDALKAGTDVTGAELSAPRQTLSIRVK